MVVSKGSNKRIERFREVKGHSVLLDATIYSIGRVDNANSRSRVAGN